MLGFLDPRCLLIWLNVLQRCSFRCPFWLFSYFLVSRIFLHWVSLLYLWMTHWGLKRNEEVDGDGQYILQWCILSGLTVYMVKCPLVRQRRQQLYSLIISILSSTDKDVKFEHDESTHRFFLSRCLAAVEGAAGGLYQIMLNGGGCFGFLSVCCRLFFRLHFLDGDDDGVDIKQCLAIISPLTITWIQLEKFWRVRQTRLLLTIFFPHLLYKSAGRFSKISSSNFDIFSFCS